MDNAVTATAPLRLDLAGGWTDVPPFSAEHGGVVVNTAIRLRARATWIPGGTTLRLEARDLGRTIEVDDVASLDIRGPLALATAAVRRFPVKGGTLRTESDAPPGSGLGSSGAMGVALVAALQAARGEKCDRAGIAGAAWLIEAVDAGFPGGRQDQHAAALGGIHRLTFRDPAVTADPLKVPAGVMKALERRMVLCYTGTSRVSSRMISRVVEGWQRRFPPVVQALHGLVETAEAMTEALQGGDLARIGALLDANWAHQRSLDEGMCTDDMARLEQAMRSAGALGGKAAGAGAGGCMFFLAGDDPAPLVGAARALGADVLTVAWDDEGVTTC